MNSDEMREWCYLHTGDLRHDAILAAADAWDRTELRRIKEGERFLDRIMELEKRLEAAVALGKAQCYKHANGDDACMCEQWDALAGKET